MIRWATIDDVPRLVEMALAFYATTQYPALIPASKEQMAGLAITMMKDHMLLVAEKDGEVVGMVSLIIEPFIFNPSFKVANELVWWIDEVARGGMTAVRLLREAEVQSKKFGVTMIRMAKMAGSPGAAGGLYRKLGYTLSDSHYEKVL